MSKGLPQRRIILSFVLADGTTKTIEGLNVKFSIKKFCAAFGGEADISIANLTMDDLTYLTTLLSLYTAISRKKTVSIIAGYDNNIAEIFKGEIWRAFPVKRGADIWLDIKAIKGLYAGCAISSKSIIQKAKMKDVGQRLADWIGLKYQWLANSDKEIDAFEMTGSHLSALKKYNTLDNIIAFEEDDTLKVIDKDNPKGLGQRLVSENNGMIGMPQLDNIGAKITTLLDNTVKLGSTIKLESKLCPVANGDYWTYAVTHTGSLRDTAFYSIFECRRGGSFF